jgi:carboxypeptidase family protein
VSTVQSARRAQSLLLAGLVGVMALSAGLLWTLRAGSTRGRGAGDGSAASGGTAELATPAGILEGTTPGSTPAGEAGPERTAVVRADARTAGDAFDPAAITGRVLCGGEPVAGVTLRLFPGMLERRERGVPLAETQSDAEGRFRFRAQVPFTRHALHAQHEGYLPEEESVFPGHDEPIELQRAAAVSGVVRDRDGGGPLAGVEVALERWHLAPSGPRERMSSTSDAEGRWQLPWARPGIEQFLVVRPGFVPERREFQVTEEGGEGYEIWLDSAAALELELYALEDGAPLAERDVLCDETPVRTDTRGHLRVPFPATGSAEESLRVTLALPDGCLTQGRVERKAMQGVLRVPLARGGTVTGRVLDDAGAPVADAQVRTSGGGRAPAGLGLPDGFTLNAPRNRARSGADGSFTLSGLPPRTGELELRAQHPEHPPGRSEPFETPKLGVLVERDVVLEKGATITGVVRLDGEPAPVRVYWEGERANGWTRANDRGAYRIVGVPSGEVFLRPRLDDEDEDTPRAEDVTLPVEPAAELVADFELTSRRARIRGRVVDTHGAPVAEADVVAVLSEEVEGLDEEPRTESESDGTFELLVPEAPGLLFDVAAQSGPRRAEVRAVRAGRELELVLPALAPVVLHVVDSRGRAPVLGFQVYWRSSEDGSFARLVQGGRRFAPGPDGTFVAELPIGRLDLAITARDHGFVSARRDGIEVLEGLTPRLEFELEQGLELELVIAIAPEHGDALRMLQRGRFAVATDEQWADRARGGELFQDEVRNAQALRVDEAGVARLKAMASGGYRFFNAPRGFQFQPREFEVPPVAQHRVEVKLEPEAPKKPRGGGD